MKPSPLASSSAAARKSPPPGRPDSSNHLLTLALFVIAVIAGGLAWWEHGRAADLEAQLAAKNAPAPAAPGEPAPVPVARVAPPEPPPFEEPPPPPVDDRAARQRAGLAAIGSLLNNPQIQQLAAGVTQNLVSSAYAGFVQQMNMGEEQAAAFNALVAQRALIGQQVLRDASAQGLDLQTNGQQLQQQVRQAEAQVDQQVRGLLGDGGFQQYQDYTRNVQQQFRGGFQGGN